MFIRNAIIEEATLLKNSGKPSDLYGHHQKNGNCLQKQEKNKGVHILMTTQILFKKNEFSKDREKLQSSTEM